MVTGGGKLIEMPIKRLPVVVSPSCAHLVDERFIRYNNNNMLEHTWRVKQTVVADF